MSSSTQALYDRLPAISSLRYPAYRLLMAGVTPHLLSMQMSTVAMGYLAYSLTNSATLLGLIGLGWGIPMLVLSLVGGVMADRFPRRTILLFSQSLVGSAALLGAILLVTGLIQVWHIFVIALLQGISFAFNMPARQALIGEFVEAEELGNAIALNNTLMNFSRVIGPPLAGFLIVSPWVGLNGVFVLMASLYLVVLAMLWRLPRLPAPANRRQNGWESLKDGLGHIRRSPALLGLLALALTPMFFGMPHQTLLPVFALQVLDSGATGLGLLNMASGIGSVIGSLAVTVVVGQAAQRRTQMLLGLLFGLALIGFAASGNLLLAAIGLAVVGAASAGYMSLNNGLIMNATPREYHGRVMSVYMMTWSLMPIASLPAGSLADQIGAPVTVGGMGLILLLSIIALSIWQGRIATPVEPSPVSPLVGSPVEPARSGLDR